MLKNLIALILLSILVILFAHPVYAVLQTLIDAHDWVSKSLMQIFSGGTAGDLIRKLLALLCIPFVASLIPASIYWLIKRKWLPCFMECTWLIWLMQTTALIIQYKSNL